MVPRMVRSIGLSSPARLAWGKPRPDSDRHQSAQPVEDFRLVLCLRERGNFFPNKLQVQFPVLTHANGDIGILGEARSAPTLYSNTTNEAGAPFLKLTEGLKISCRVEDVVGDLVRLRHPRSFLNKRCCSTIPEYPIRLGFW